MSIGPKARVTPEMLKAAQKKSEIGEFVCS